MTTLKTYKPDWILFAEAGFIAVNHADEDAAIKLFRAAELLEPDNILPKIGFGYLHLHKLELKEAIHCFEQVLEVEPDNDMAKTFLGLSLGLMPNMAEKGEKFLRQVEKSKDPAIKTLSSYSMDFIHKFVKKAPGPAGS
jgi:tetratricopeptide (TPR) repeat protein